MDVSIIVPAQASEAAAAASTLQGIFGQKYDDGQIEVFVVQYGGGAAIEISASGRSTRFLNVDHPSPYAARNLGAREAKGHVLIFTEPGCIPDSRWVTAHVGALGNGRATISVGHVAPIRETWSVSTFMSYENVRDRWVFSGQSWRHMFGRPKNMAIARHRFESHGPFAEVLRGADSTLVQLVARELSPAEVAHTPSAVVHQQVVRGLPSCLRDRFVHARALRVHRSGHAAPIGLASRARIFRATVAERGYGPGTSFALLGFLAAGIIAFRLGGASARFVRDGR
jgi:hypothetical protein